MPSGNRRPLYSADELPAVDQQSTQSVPGQPVPSALPVAPADSGVTFKQPCTLKGLSAALYAGALGYFLGFVPATIKFKAKQWGMTHSQGMASASQLALMSGMYTAVHCICQRIRMVEDGWNRGIAGCSTGLVLGWKTGPWGALQSCASLGLLSALIDFGGGAVEAAEAAMLHQLQEQQSQLQQQQIWVPSQCSSSTMVKQGNVIDQLVSFVADPCTALVCMQQLRQQQHNITEPNSSGHWGLSSSVGAAVQQVQQVVTTPPLMFLGACCQAKSSSISNTDAAPAVAGPVVDACELRLQQAAARGPHKRK